MGSAKTSPNAVISKGRASKSSGTLESPYRKATVMSAMFMPMICVVDSLTVCGLSSGRSYERNRKLMNRTRFLIGSMKIRDSVKDREPDMMKYSML